MLADNRAVRCRAAVSQEQVMEKKDKPAVQKKPEAPAAAKGWPAPKNTFAPKERAMDRKPGSRGSARGR